MRHEDLDVSERSPGELIVTIDRREVTVVVPAGIGVPGVDDEELAQAVVAELADRGAELPPVLDVSAALRSEPGLLHALAQRVDPEG